MTDIDAIRQRWANIKQLRSYTFSTSNNVGALMVDAIARAAELCYESDSLAAAPGAFWMARDSLRDILDLLAEACGPAADNIDSYPTEP